MSIATVTAIITIVLGVAGLVLRYRKKFAQYIELGRLRERDETAGKDRRALSEGKEIQDAVESLGSAQLRDELGRFVRK